MSLFNDRAAAAPVVAAPVTVRSLSETMNVTAVAPVEPWLWVGTSRGLVKWDLKSQSKVASLGKGDGLPSERIDGLVPDGSGGLWVLTAAGVAHETKGAWKNLPGHPVGAFVTGLVTTPDGALWAGGPDGLARMKKDRWERLLGQTAVNALVAKDGEVWVGTDGKGVVRVVGDKAEVYGPTQGCGVDVVRGIAQTGTGIVAVGEGPSGPRLAWWDGSRFWSYALEVPSGSVVEWVRRVGNDTVVAAGGKLFALRTISSTENAAEALKLKFVPTIGRKPAEAIHARSDVPTPPAHDEKRADAPTPSDEKKAAPATATNGKPEAKSDGKPDAKADAKTAKTDAKDAKAAAAPAKPDAKEPEADKAEDAPKLDARAWGTLPEQVTAVAPEGASLYVGTRFLGAARVDAAPDDKSASPLVAFRTGDIAQEAVKLSVACEPNAGAIGTCWVATGGPRAFRFDGKTFDPASIDPEPGSRVLAVLRTPQATILAIHRGAKDPVLRMSTVAGDSWTPIGAQEVKVPEGVPDVTFARFAPSGKLWLGLRYLDAAGDGVDYGAAEVDMSNGAVLYHRRIAASVQHGPEIGAPLPNDLEAVFFRSPTEAWFGARTGAVRLVGSDVRVFTENDGLESEYIHDLLEGPDGRIWVATSRGVGSFDGSRWAFPPEGDRMRVRATSLARDKASGVYVGSDGGLLLLSPQGAGEPPRLEKFTRSEGLLDDKVLALAVDPVDRVWALTEKGLSILARTPRAASSPSPSSASATSR